MDVNEKLKFLGKFTKKLWGVGVGGRVRVGGGGQGGCDRRIEVFVNFKKKNWGGGRRGLGRGGWVGGSGWM